MEKQKKIVDASVIVKWFSEEKGTSSALKILNLHSEGKLTLIIPELALLETLNALRYKKVKENNLTQIIHALKEIQLHIEYLSPFVLEQTSDLAMKYDLTIYDALYVALSQIHETPLVTADKELGKLSFVELLE